jgi:pseudaminic acid synthase
MKSCNGSTFIIAEISANHGSSFEVAAKTVRAIAAAGADAVKVQTYKPESLCLDVDNEYFGPKRDGSWKGIRPWDLYREAAMPYEWQPRLKDIADEVGLLFFSSPFDLHAVDFLSGLQVPCYKIASFEITDIPLIQKAASMGKPMIISAGVAGESDIQAAVFACRAVGNDEITLLKCTSEYPARIDQANLSMIADMRERFGLPVGISDHTMGSLVPTIAVALGATMVEKHFILDRAQGGPDSAFSMEPLEFAQMVEQVRATEQALGLVDYRVSEKDRLRRRSLFWVKSIAKGDIITAEHLRSLRPGHGLPPQHLDALIGKRAARAALLGEPTDWTDIEGGEHGCRAS